MIAHTPGPWYLVDWLARSFARVYAVRRDWFGGVDYMTTPTGKRRRFRTAEAARAAIAKAEGKS
ncbi:MAG TPA: hypothetical protein VMY41_16295 [Thermohalobaculum sp.]|nr:hypothetical protein [Thermohalobaculum sp.]